MSINIEITILFAYLLECPILREMRRNFHQRVSTPTFPVHQIPKGHFLITRRTAVENSLESDSVEISREPKLISIFIGFSGEQHLKTSVIYLNFKID